MPENKIRVTAIQRLCVNDGPGVRTVVFLKGCYLHCPWCCNPEAIQYDGDEYFDEGKCKYPEKNKLCQNCELFGGKQSKEMCPLGVYEKTYSDYSVDELFELLMRDISLYRGGGGVTFSGGEPLFQAEALEPLLNKLKKENVNICFETTLYAPVVKYMLIRNYVDYWLVDLKFQYGYIQNNKYKTDTSLLESNLMDIQKEEQNHCYRMVIMKEILYKTDLIVAELLKHHIDTIELLPYHALAENKYKKLKMTFHRFGTPTNNDMEMLKETIESRGIECHFLQL